MAGCDPFEAGPLGLQAADQHFGLIRRTHHHLGLAEGIEQLQLRRQARLIGALPHRDHHFTFRGGLEGVEGPKQGMGLQDQHPIVALPRGPRPQALAQGVEAFPFRGGLPLQPALQLGIVGAAAQHIALVGRRFGRGGELGGPALLEALAQGPLPAQVAWLPKHLALEACGQVLLGHPVLGVGMGVAVAGAIAKGLAIAVPIAQVGRHLLLVGRFDAFEGIKKSQQAVALFGAGEIQRCLG